jgi:hypothetical protein
MAHTVKLHASDASQRHEIALDRTIMVGAAIVALAVIVAAGLLTPLPYDPDQVLMIFAAP